jgi:DNA-binding MarR family transcriptional regulator
MIIMCNTNSMTIAKPASAKPEGPRPSAAFLLAQVGAYAAGEFAKALAPLKLAPSDAGILRLLHHAPGISQRELAQRLEMHASRLVAVIDALEARGLVAREANLQDRRIYSLRLTDAGGEMLRAVGQAARNHNEAMCAGLDAAERAELTSLLQRIAAHHGLAPGVHPGYRDLAAAK